MLVSAVVCPHPPALVPAVSQGAADRLADVRQACLDAVRRLAATEAELLVCVGAGPELARWGGDAGGSLHGFGVDVRFGGAQLVLPEALAVAAYLLETVGTRADVYQAIPKTVDPATCATLGAQLGDETARVAMLVMGDGSAKRTTASPGYYDSRAVAFDANVMAALNEPDTTALLAIDPAMADDLWVAGRQAWQTLAGALAANRAAWSGHVEHASAPLGVGYVVIRLEAGT